MLQTRTWNDADNRLRTAVAIQLDWEPEVISRDISISASDGVVTLTGFVRSHYEKMAAETAAKSVYGVKVVANDIAIEPAGLRTDPEIARDLVHAMAADVTVAEDKIKVAIHDGHVSLDGYVNWEFQRTGAAACALRVPGVRDVINNIFVRISLSPSDVKAKIEEALEKSSEVDSHRISVAATGGAIHLYGDVRSWFEREEAERAAWAAPGVSKVVDHITVVP